MDMTFFIACLLTLIAASAVFSFCLPQYRNTNSRIGNGLIFAAFVISFYQSLADHGLQSININLITVNKHPLIFSLWYDNIAHIMVPFALFIAFAIYQFSQRYLMSEVTRPRFLTQLCLVLFSVVLLLLSANFFTAFIAWQFIGLSLYLLLNHYHYDLQANRAAKKKFAINRIGDLCFLIAVVLSLQSPTTISFANLQSIPHPIATSILIFIAVMTKSAQFPFHIWLADTMETPTPVSALMHAGVINSGGILLAKLAPIIVMLPAMMLAIAIVGLISVCIGMFLMLNQADVKKKLAYSTMGQMGYMIMQCGVGIFSTAIFHLMSHGFFKVCLFLHAGESLMLKTHYQKRNQSWFASCIAIVLSIISMFFVLWLALLLHFYQPIIIWGFIFITLLQINRQLWLSTHSAVTFLFAFIMLTLAELAYIAVLHIFTVYLAGLDNEVSSVWQIAAISVAILFQIICWHQPVLSRHRLYRLIQFFNVENIYRLILLNPLRWLGDRANNLVYKFHFMKKMPALFISACLILAFITITINNKSLQDFCLWFFIFTLLLSGVIANRAKHLLRIWMWILILEVSFISIGLAEKNIFLHKVIIFHLCNILMVILMMAILMAGKKRQNKRAQTYLKFNRLPWFMFYLSTGLLLIIGIPGSASFIAELFLLNQLLQSNMTAMIFYSFAMLLLSIVILHTLQTYVFDNERLIYSKKNLGTMAHFICCFTIIFNIVNGLDPSLLLNVI